VLSIVCKEISELLERNGRNWIEFPGLPVYNPGLLENRLLLEESNYARESLLRDVSGSTSFTEVQAVAYSRIMDSIESGQGEIIF
jgi:hypothetical protein